MIMNLEYLRLAQARDLICSLGSPTKAMIRQCRTDCWLVSTSKKKAAEIKRLLEAQTFQSIQKGTPFHRPQVESLTEECPFRILDLSGDKLERHRLKLPYKVLGQGVSANPPALVPEPVKLLEGKDDVWAVARECIKNLQGVLIHWLR